jgi:hypothetical protein
MTGLNSWLETLLKPTPERAERRSIDRFAAYRWNGSQLKQEVVKNISATGLYIFTEERWQVGTVVSLTLQKEGPLDMNPERRIEVQAKVVRCGEDGVGLEFVLQEDAESRQWEDLRQSLLEQARPKDMLSLVRMVEAVAFLSRICPGGAEKVGGLIQGRLGNLKLANAVTIALTAENQLAHEPSSCSMRADPDTVVRILEDGSCTDEDWLKHFWGGLLATSCAVDRNEKSGLVFVELFSQLTTFPVRILTVVCTRATKVFAESGSISAKPLACQIEELMQTTGSRGVQIERDLQRLSELGLLQKGYSTSPTLLAHDEIFITPTNLALQLFARCNGHRGSLWDFYAPRAN